ncbi:YeeE/YedE family protein [Acetomicrobium sp. S15 = DSM 107314]|uniref:YeeE/YedE family protein n=1 Tax=Acetomicrobium sp. S15 = DSM 107314 TaxID=2529858 RepID=UPI0018E15303|nr:YeeE/YedE family protein [Acetomicrobium sp. S15 = DSM 107314]
MIFSGFLIGLIFGALLQRSRMCFNSAFRDVLLFKDNYLLKMALLAVAVQMVLVHLLAQMGLIALAPSGLNWVANIVGAYIFGLGMVLAGGCASGVTYRAGEGLTTAWFAAIFYGGTAYAMRNGGVFSGVWKWFQGFGVAPFQYFDQATGEGFSRLYLQKAGQTLPSVFGVNPWIVVVICVGLILWYVFGTQTSERESKIGLKMAAVLLGAVGAFAWYFSELVGRNYGMGITGGWSNIWSVWLSGKPFSWDGLSVFGIVVGAAISAVMAKEFKLRMPRNPITYVQVMGGGIVMGFGATIAGG